MARNFLFPVFLFALVLAAPQIAAAEEGTDMVPLNGEALTAANGTGEDNTTGITQYVYGNTMGDAYSGNISGVSVSNNNGVTNVIQNTGNQVSIATATTVIINTH